MDWVLATVMSVIILCFLGFLIGLSVQLDKIQATVDKLSAYIKKNKKKEEKK